MSAFSPRSTSHSPIIQTHRHAVGVHASNPVQHATHDFFPLLLIREERKPHDLPTETLTLDLIGTQQRIGGTNGLQGSLEIPLADARDLHLRRLTPRGLVRYGFHSELFWKHDILTVRIHGQCERGNLGRSHQHAYFSETLTNPLNPFCRRRHLPERGDMNKNTVSNKTEAGVLCLHS